MHGKLSKPIFLIGCPRSGTTVISESIYVHPELGWFSHYFDNYPDTGGSFVAKYVKPIDCVAFYFK